MVFELFEDSGGDQVIAYRYPTETQWRDPWGGDFSSDEQTTLTRIARGLEHQFAIPRGRTHYLRLRIKDLPFT